MIKIDKLSKKYDKDYVLKDLSCNIKDNSIYGLVGANGSGKSTLLRTIIGIYKADGGVISVDGIEKYVALGILKEKTQIPSIREMAGNLGINPNTVKKSYDILENRGVITTISTKGTFISENTKKATDEKINKEISIIREKIDELTKMGISYDEIIERIKK